MNKIGFIFILLLFPTSVFCQTRFTEGYVIDNEGNRIDCLLMNRKIENKGEGYTIKFYDKDEYERINIRKYKEFGIPGKSKFVRSKIRLDVSDDRIKTLIDTLNHAVIQEGDAYLQELIGSNEAALYYFFFQGKEYFFFRVGDSGITLLVHKKYRIELLNDQTTKVLLDNRYKRQLEEYLRCSKNVKTLSYTRNSLLKYFKAYHQENDIHTDLEGNFDKAIFSARLSGSLNQHLLSIDEANTELVDFDRRPSFGFGTEIEYMFAFNRNKFGLFAECNYSSFNSISSPDNSDLVFEISYRAIDFPFGIVYKVNLSERSKIYLKVGGAPNLIMEGSSFSLYRPENNYSLRNSTNFLLAGGYSYGPISIEARSYFKRNLTTPTRESEFEQYSLKLGLRFLDF